MHYGGVTHDDKYIHGHNIIELFLDLCSTHFWPRGEKKQGYYGVADASVVRIDFIVNNAHESQQLADLKYNRHALRTQIIKVVCFAFF